MNKRTSRFNKISLWICWIVMLLALYIMWGMISALCVLLATLLFTGLNIASAFFTARRIDVEFSVEGSQDGKNTVICKTSLKLAHEVIPVLYSGEYQVENCLTGEKINFSIDMPASQFTIHSTYCGKVEVTLKKICVSDLAGLCKFHKEIGVLQKALMLPSVYDIDSDAAFSGVFDLEGIEYSKVKAGSDPSEIFALREYVAGDSVKAIHWKLSNKVGQILIKESGLPLKNSALILMETSFPEEGEALKQRSAKTVTAVLSLSEELLDKGISHQIMWMNHRLSELSVHKIDSVENLLEMLPQLLSAQAIYGKESIDEEYLEERGLDGFTHLAVIDNEITGKSLLFN